MTSRCRICYGGFSRCAHLWISRFAFDTWSFADIPDILHGSYLASLVFGENCRKIGGNISGPESIKWWHYQCVSHKVMTSPMSVQSESSICWGAFPTSWIFIKNPLVTSSLFAFQIKYFHSPRMVHTALSNSKARQVRSWTQIFVLWLLEKILTIKMRWVLKERDVTTFYAEILERELIKITMRIYVPFFVV